MKHKGKVFAGLGLGVIAFIYFTWTEHMEKKQPFPRWQEKSGQSQLQNPSLPQQSSVKKAPAQIAEAATSQLKSAEKVILPRREETSKSEVIVDQQSDVRDFVMPEKHPGYNMEVFEDKKVDFLIQQLRLFPKDAEEISQRYQLSLQESNHAMRTQSEKAMKRISHITAEYEEWLTDKLGEEDFLKYSEYVRFTMNDLQQRIKAYRETQRQQLGN